MLQLRVAVPSDAERLGNAVAEGFQSYLAFAPDGWTPRPASDEQARARRFYEREGWMVDSQSFCDPGFVPADRRVQPLASVTIEAAPLMLCLSLL